MNKLLLEDPTDGKQLRLLLEGDGEAKRLIEEKWFGPIRKRIAELSWWKRWQVNRLMKQLKRKIDARTVDSTGLFYCMDYIDIMTRKMAGVWDETGR